MTTHRFCQIVLKDTLKGIKNPPKLSVTKSGDLCHVHREDTHDTITIKACCKWDARTKVLEQIEREAQK